MKNSMKMVFYQKKIKETEIIYLYTNIYIFIYICIYYIFYILQIHEHTHTYIYVYTHELLYTYMNQGVILDLLLKIQTSAPEELN